MVVDSGELSLIHFTLAASDGPDWAAQAQEFYRLADGNPMGDAVMYKIDPGAFRLTPMVVPGNPTANQMETNIDMNDNNLNNANQVNANQVITPAGNGVQVGKFFLLRRWCKFGDSAKRRALYPEPGRQRCSGHCRGRKCHCGRPGDGRPGR